MIKHEIRIVQKYNININIVFIVFLDTYINIVKNIERFTGAIYIKMQKRLNQKY